MANPATVDVAANQLTLAHCTVAPSMIDGFPSTRTSSRGQGCGDPRALREQPVTLPASRRFRPRRSVGSSRATSWPRATTLTWPAPRRPLRCRRATCPRPARTPAGQPHRARCRAPRANACDAGGRWPSPTDVTCVRHIGTFRLGRGEHVGRATRSRLRVIGSTTSWTWAAPAASNLTQLVGERRC